MSASTRRAGPAHRIEGEPSGAAAASAHLGLPADLTVADLGELTRAASVAAFVAMMRRRQPGFAVDAHNHVDVAELCAVVRGRRDRLEAAARMAGAGAGLRTVAEIMGRGGWDSGDAGDGEDAGGAAAGRRGAGGSAGPPFAARIGAATAGIPIRAGSDPRLEPALRAAALCADGLGPEALARIAGLPDADALAPLTAAGLLEASADYSGSADGPPAARRYRLASPVAVRRAAADGDDGDGPLRAAHGDYFLRLAQTEAGRLWTRDQPLALLSLGQERRNIDTALRWALAEGRGERAVAVTAALAPYWRRLTDLPALRGAVTDLIGLQSVLPAADAHRVHVLAADAFTRLGEHEAAMDAVAAAARLAAQTRLEPAAEADQLFATGLALHGRAGGRALDLLRRAVHSYQALGRAEQAAAAQFELSGVEFLAGRARDADTTARSALSSAIRRGDELTAAALLLRLGAFAAAGGDRTGCDGYVERALVKLRGLGAAAALGVLAGQVDTHLEPSVVRRATGTARLLGSFCAHHRAEFRDPSPDYPVGRVERRLLGQLGEQALIDAVTEGARTTLPELLAELAARTYARPATGDAARTSALTRRETQVALLVGEGLTNREVASRLEISEWTVVNHMRQIMRKLECASRVQVACWVIANL